MEKNNTLVIGLLVLLVGFGFGYFIGNNPTSYKNSGMHMMPNGTMMRNTDNSMEHSMGMMMGNLVGKTGDEFDEAFLREMIVHHQGAVVMAESALKYAKHEEIKNLSRAIISAQNKEITDMQNWLRNWYGN